MVQFSTILSHMHNSSEFSPSFNVSDQNSLSFFFISTLQFLYSFLILCFLLFFFPSCHLTYSFTLLSFFAFLFLWHHFSLFLSSFFISSSFRSLLPIVCDTHFTPEQFLYACVILDQLQMKRRL